MRRSFLQVGWMACLLTAALGAVALPAALALDARKDAQKIAAEEMAASEQAAGAHDHRKAYEHALQASQLDDSAAYLWAAANQATLAGLDDAAEPLFKQWLGRTGRDIALDLPTRKLLADIVHRQAAAKAAQAAVASKSGDHGAARRLYLEAAALDRDDAEHLYGAGLEALAARDDVAGTRLLADYVKLAPAHAASRPHAAKLLADRGIMVASVTADGFAPAASAPLPPRRQAALWTAGGAAVLALVGGGYFLSSASAAADLQAARDRGAPGSEQQPLTARHDAHFAAGIGLEFAAVAAAGVGAWLWWGGTDARASRLQLHVQPDRIVAGLSF